jgi:hypothetical protein
MSHCVCHLWDGFVEALERRAGVPSAPADSEPAQRAARAVRRIRFGSREELADAVAAVLLVDGPAEAPAQTRALARLFWPLVLTTNYDDLYVAAAHEEHLRVNPRIRKDKEDKLEMPLLLLGRSPEDCRRVLSSLRQPDVPILWAVQGYIGGQALALASHTKDKGALYRDHATMNEQREQLKKLRRELVVGHAEYRRVAMASEPFRRAFAELYRSRSLLFLGTGLRDKYFLDLFSEIIELYGPSPHAHYALVDPNTTDADFLQRYFGTWVWETEHDQLPALLEELARRIAGPRSRQLSWQLVGRAKRPNGPVAKPSRLSVVRGPLPAEVGAGGCIVFSSGGSSGRFRLSNVAKQYRDRKGRVLDAKQFEQTGSAREGTRFIRKHENDHRFLAVNARLDPWTREGARLRPVDPKKKPFVEEKRTAGGRVRRDIRLVSIAVEKLMLAAQQLEYDHVHTMLLAAGALRTFPQSHALMQMVRGWARWQETAVGAQPDLSIYVTARDVLYDLDAGRLNLTRFLTPDIVEFWVEIDKRDTESERYLEVAPTDRSLLCVISGFDIKGDDWKLELTPRPSLEWDNWLIGEINTWNERFQPPPLDLETFGVLPGSILRLTK